MADGEIDSEGIGRLNKILAEAQQKSELLTLSANGFAGAMTRAFQQSAIGGRQLDEVLRGLALRLSDLAVKAAFKPITQGIVGGLNGLFAGLFGMEVRSRSAQGAIKPFAAGGVIAAPTYFPLSSGGLGLAGEAGPEAILPLARGADGRLGVAASGAAATHVTIQIITPDIEGFRRSEGYLTGQIARAVARGHRSL
jgi:phage-related minor tail protein